VEGDQPELEHIVYARGNTDDKILRSVNAEQLDLPKEWKPLRLVMLEVVSTSFYSFIYLILHADAAAAA
jgi:hypothetical protein